MKKIMYFLAAGLFLASCSRDVSDDTTQGAVESRSNVFHFSQSDLDGMLTQMNQSFNVSAKAATQLNYTYRAYAEPVTIPGHTMAASAIFAIDDMVFVTWHSNAGPVVAGATSSLSGSICAYKLSGIGQYTFTDRVDFSDADYHEVTAHRNSLEGNIEVFAVGQRNVAQSGYLLNGHNGAVVTRIDYDYINDEFNETSVKELPLPGVSANDIVAGAAHLYCVTGDGEGGSDGAVYEFDRSMSQVKKVNNSINDGQAIVADETTQTSSAADLYILDRVGAGRYRIHNMSTSLAGDNTTWASSVNFVSDLTGVTAIDDERADLTWAQHAAGASDPSDSLIVSFGYNGIYRAGTGVNGMTNVKNIGPCLSTAYDANLAVLYYADGDDGVSVLAMEDFEGGALISTYDIIGQFAPPTGGIFPASFLIKEMTIYQTRHMALAAAEAGVYFIQRDKI